MKSIIASLLATTVIGNAAITISGTAVTNMYDAAGSERVNAQTALLIVDVDRDGFFSFTNNGLDPSMHTTSTEIGGLFGGDLVLNVLATSSAGSVAGLLSNVAVADYLNMDFAVVWFDGNSNYGIVRGSDWTFPASDSGTYTMSATDANGESSYYQVNALTGPTPATAFTTNGARFQIVPEPSILMLGALSSLMSFRRRR